MNPTDPTPDTPAQRATRTGSWLLDRQPAFRTFLALTTLGFALVGLASPGIWGDGAALVALTIAILWAVFEGVWLVIDRATPDSAAEPPGE